MEYQTTNLNIKAWAEEDRPREKLLEKGRVALTDAELLGILIGSGIKNMTAVDLAKLILQSVGNDLHKLGQLSVKDLSKFKGIGEAKAITIIAALEIGRRRKETEKIANPKVITSIQAYNYLKPYMLDLDHEQFWILVLNNNSNVIKTIQISIGGVTGTVADPKIIFKHAIENLAKSIILAHNHPSGNLTPSRQDITITKQLIEVGKILEIAITDHIIFTNNGFTSLADEKLI